MMRLALVLLVAGGAAGCVAGPPQVTAEGILPAPAFAVAGDGAAAAELTRQLSARGWFAENATTTIHPGFAVAPRAVGTCALATPEGCTQWLDEPETGWDPLAPPLRFRLTLAFESPAEARFAMARLTTTHDGDAGDQPLAELVSAALDRLAAPPKPAGAW